MTVKDLIIKLFELNPNLPVYKVTNEDDDIYELEPIRRIESLNPSCNEETSGYILR